MQTQTITDLRRAFELIADGYDLLPDAIRAAWRDHSGSGANAWKATCEAHLGDVRKRVPSEVRKTIANSLRYEDGMSTRAIAAVFGVSHTQIRKDTGGNQGSTSTGTDGKTYSRPKRAPKVDLDDDADVNAAFADITNAEQSAELESVRKELSEARARVAELERLETLAGELNELRSALLLARKQVRTGLGEDSRAFTVIQHAMNRITSLESKLE